MKRLLVFLMFVLSSLACRGAKQDDFNQQQQTNKLISAIRENNIEEIKSIVSDERFDVNKLQASGSKIPLVYAAQKNNLDVVKILIEAGADILSVDLTKKQRPSQMTTDDQIKNLLQSLKKKVGDIFDAMNDQKDQKIIETLIKELKTDLEKKVAAHASRGSKSLYGYAMHVSRPDYIPLLLAAKIDPRIFVGGVTALHAAAKFRSAVSIQRLLESGYFPNVNIQDKSGKTALHHAVVSNNPREALELVRYGASFDIPDNRNKKPLDLKKATDFLKALKNFYDNKSEENRLAVLGNRPSNEIEHEELKAILEEEQKSPAQEILAPKQKSSELENLASSLKTLQESLTKVKSALEGLKGAMP